MALLNNTELREAFNYLSTIENILKKEIKLVDGNKSQLDKIVPKNIARVYSLKEN